MFDVLKFKFTANDQTGAAFSKIKGQLKGVDGALAGIRDRAMATGRAMRNIGAGLTVGVTAPLALLGKQSVQLYDTQVKAQAAVATAIKSTGGAAGFTAKELERMAASLQGATTFGDEEILGNLTAPLLTFTKVQGEVFERAQAATLDMATLLKTDLKSAALQVGKALNDPIKGVTALSRAGVQFSDDQKKVIERLVETGRVAEAQGIILAELETQFAGQAAAAAATPLGQWAQLSNAIGDVKEQLGAEITPFLAPLLEHVRNAVTWFSALDEGVKRNIVIFGGLAAAVGPVLSVLGLATIGITALGTAFKALTIAIVANPIGRIVTGLGIAALMAKRLTDKVGGIGPAFTLVKEVAVEVLGRLKDGAALVGDAFVALGQGIQATLLNAFATVIEGFSTFTETMASGINNLFSKVGVDLDLSGIGSEAAASIRAMAGEVTAAATASRAELDAGFKALTGPLTAIQNMRDALANGPETDTVLMRSKSHVQELDLELANLQTTLNGIVETGGVPGAITGAGGGGGGGRGASIEDPAVTRTLEGIDRIKAGVRNLLTSARSFGDIWQGVLRMGAERLLDFAMDRAWGMLKDNMTTMGGVGGGGGGLGNLLFRGISWLFGGNFAKGAAFSAGLAIPFAAGGVVSSPTMFPMAGGKAGVMGEAGPEAIMPLTRVGGSLGVRAELPQATGGPSITINVDARGAADPEEVQRRVRQGIAEAVPSILAAARGQSVEVVRDYKRRGGLKA